MMTELLTILNLLVLLIAVAVYSRIESRLRDIRFRMRTYDAWVKILERDIIDERRRERETKDNVTRLLKGIETDET